MGGPSAAIVAEELIGLGARRLVRVGTCGALGATARSATLLVAGEACCEDGASRALGADERAAADPELQAALSALAGAAVLVVSADLFYDPELERARTLGAAGAVAVEMEAATLFAVARLHGARRGMRLRGHRHRRPRRADRRRRGCSPPSWASARRRLAALLGTSCWPTRASASASAWARACRRPRGAPARAAAGQAGESSDEASDPSWRH